jgi:hypothetical protein
MDVAFGVNQKTMDISSLERGIYFIQIRTDEETSVEKLIKN